MEGLCTTSYEDRNGLRSSERNRDGGIRSKGPSSPPQRARGSRITSWKRSGGTLPFPRGAPYMS